MIVQYLLEESGLDPYMFVPIFLLLTQFSFETINFVVLETFTSAGTSSSKARIQQFPQMLTELDRTDSRENYHKTTPLKNICLTTA